jgi:hypothetical protein
MPICGSVRSVTAGSLRAGDCEEPIRAGPPVSGGAPTPVRKRRMFATSVRARRRSGTPASSAHGCGSPKMAPLPICPRAP